MDDGKNKHLKHAAQQEKLPSGPNFQLINKVFLP